MPTMYELLACDRLQLRATRLRDRLSAVNRWGLSDEGDYEEIVHGGALDLWDDDKEGYAWNVVNEMCAQWSAELNNKR